MEKQEFLRLIDRYLEGKASVEEQEALYRYYNSFQQNEDWNEMIPGDPASIEAAVFARISDAIHTKETPVHRVGGWRRWAVAASIIVIAGLGGYFAFFNKDAASPIGQIQSTKDVAAPSLNRAMITLANGEKVFLDSSSNGMLGMQGHVKILKQQDGSIRYETAGQEVVVGYNTIVNPRGSKVQTLTLTDGTQVWLNAGSSLRYPAAFTGNERKVELTGEAYFAVVHNEQMPFMVMANGIEIRDLGTEFNVNTYNDEPDTRVTLVNGLLEVRSRGADRRLTPGQQARVSDRIKLVPNADLPSVLAWKNGFFSFNEADLKTVMRQVARWYDIAVEYEGQVYQGTFSGRIGQDLSLKELLDGLSGMKLKFRIEGKRLVLL